jgi:ABC-type uncharacterized transport system substrate-binding protein
MNAAAGSAWPVVRVDYGRRGWLKQRPGIVRWILLGATVLTSPQPLVWAAEPAAVAVLFVDRSPYTEAARALEARVRESGASCELFALSTADERDARAVLERLKLQPPQVIATAGLNLTAEALRELPRSRVVFFMIPNVLDAPFIREAQTPGRLMGVTSDIAPREQIRWIRRTAPAVRKVALLCSERTRETAAALTAAGRETGLEIVAVTAQVEKFAEVTQELERRGVDGVLMIPDSQVYNAANVQHLLLWGMRSGRGVWAFSDKIVKAGALAGVYCKPEEVGREAGALASALALGRPAPGEAIRYSQRPSYGFNLHAARMLKLPVEELTRDRSVECFGGGE